MARYTLEETLGARINDLVSGEVVHVLPSRLEQFMEDYHALMHEYRQAEDTVLAILFSQYKPLDKPDTIHYS